MNRHLTTDQLVDRLYAVDRDFDHAHLESCADCRVRFDEMKRVKAETAAPESVTNDFLAAQRRSIYARLGEQKRNHVAWAPALVAAALLAIGIAVYRPAATLAPFQAAQHPTQRLTQHLTQRPTQADTADAQLFADVYSMEQSLEPSVAAPIHTLFEGNQ